MSYINQAHIYCPASVRFELKKANDYSVLWVSGEYGTWFLKINKDQYRIQIISATHLTVKTISFYNVMKHYFTKYYKYATPEVNKRCSLLCVLIKRMIVGAGVGYKKYLRVRGVGYKFELKNTILTAKVGYTHLIGKKLPYDFYIKFSRKARVIRLRNKSLTKITNFIAHLRHQRKPDVYKGKGVRYKRDPIRRKPGKRKTRSASKKRRKFFKKRVIYRHRANSFGRKLKRRLRKKRKREKNRKLQLFLNK